MRGGMQLRGIIFVAVTAAGAVLGGCSNGQPLASGLGGPAQAAEFDRDPGRKTMASKVLAAIALERVTGRKPDPARLSELN
jgi:hypothetical protein